MSESQIQVNDLRVLLEYSDGRLFWKTRTPDMFTENGYHKNHGRIT